MGIHGNIKVTCFRIRFDGKPTRDSVSLYKDACLISKVSEDRAIENTEKCIYMYSNFRGGLRKRMYFETECVMALQGHPRSLILAPVESAYATSYWSSIVTLVLPNFRDIAGFLQRRATLPLFHPNFRVFPLDWIAEERRP